MTARNPLTAATRVAKFHTFIKLSPPFGSLAHFASTVALSGLVGHVLKGDAGPSMRRPQPVLRNRVVQAGGPSVGPNVPLWAKSLSGIGQNKSSKQQLQAKVIFLTVTIM
jgi:hypothetical protein